MALDRRRGGVRPARADAGGCPRRGAGEYDRDLRAGRRRRGGVAAGV